MSQQIKPRLSRINVVLNSFTSCIPDAAEKFSGTPEMSLSEIAAQPRMLAQKFKGRISFKQLKRSTNRHCRWQLNKNMNMVNSDVKLVDFTSIFDSDFSDKSLAINLNSKKFEGVHRIFWLPHEVESILPEGMTKTLQIHFFPPCLDISKRAHAKRNFFTDRGLTSSPRSTQEFQELNLVEHGDSSLGLKAEVSSPFM